MSYYREQLEQWLKTINIKTDRVLDIGGASNPVRTRINSLDAEEYIFFDNGAEEAVVDYMPFDINIPIEKQFAGYWQEQIVNGVPSVKPNRLFQFDVVFCLEVFEYVWNPVQAIQNIFDLMSSDAFAYISFPAIYPVHNPIEIDYLRFTRNAILKYLSMVGFTQIEITPRVATKGRQMLSAFYSEEGMHPVRGSDEPYNIGYLVKACKTLLV